MRPNTIAYKEEIISLLLHMLDTAAQGIHSSQNFEREYQKRLGFQKPTDWKRYRASVDLLVDTEYAIHSAFKYRLGTPDTSDIGSLYIRLYGILNAVYLQIGAFVTIAKLLNYPNQKEMSKSFRDLEIYKLRNMAGAHTVDYKNDSVTRDNPPTIYKTNSFRVVQSELEETGKRIRLVDEKGISITYNLMEILTEYENHARDILVLLIKHSINTRYPNRTHRNQIFSTLNEKLPLLIEYSAVYADISYEKST